ncbi:MAG: Tetratricopeptide repeat protein [bacterium ADurb.Bin400]|nr:MAG: Tetratricopeptide repeat protein [bacterium ADurb.Bin400]
MNKSSVSQNNPTKQMVIIVCGVALLLIVILSGVYLIRRAVDNKKPEPDYLTLAREASSNSDYTKAEELYLAALEKDDNPRVRKELAFIYQYENKPDMAIEAYEDVLANQDLRDVGSVNNLANLYRDKHEYDKAESLYLEAINKNANFTLAIINLNHLYILQGQYGKGIELLSKHYDGTVRKIDLGIQLYSNYKQSGKTSEADSLLRELRELDPDNHKLQ